MDALADELGLEVPNDGFVFSRSLVGAEPYMPALVTKFATRMARAAGVKTHLHEMRLFSATEMIAAGIDVRTAAGRLGHADPSVTLPVYRHALEQSDREAAAALGRAPAAASQSVSPKTSSRRPARAAAAKALAARR